MKKEAAFFTLHEVRKSFGTRVVLDGVSCEIERGKTTVVLGGSGAGKSVLLKHLNGLLQPDSGSVKMEETEISDLPESRLLELRKRIGILFQDGALFDSMSVEENVSFPLLESGIRDRKRIADQVGRALEMVGLSGEGAKMPGDLSGGMRKRASLARAMITKPDCLLCDEPTAGLDPVLSDSIAHQIRDLTQESDMTAVVVTHDLGALKIVADRALFLQNGGLVFDGDLNELFSSSEPAVVEFLSASGGRG